MVMPENVHGSDHTWRLRDVDAMILVTRIFHHISGVVYVSERRTEVLCRGGCNLEGSKLNRFFYFLVFHLVLPDLEKSDGEWLGDFHLSRRR